MKFCNRLKYFRELRGYSQNKLSQLCNVSRNTISNIENGVYSPTAFLAYRLCTFLDVPFFELFYIEDPSDNEFYLELIRISEFLLSYPFSTDHFERLVLFLLKYVPRNLDGTWNYYYREYDIGKDVSFHVIPVLSQEGISLGYRYTFCLYLGDDKFIYDSYNNTHCFKPGLNRTTGHYILDIHSREIELFDINDDIERSIKNENLSDQLSDDLSF